MINKGRVFSVVLEIVISIAFVVLIMHFLNKSSNKKVDNLYKAAYSEMVVTKNRKDSSTLATITSFSLENAKTIRDLEDTRKEKDSALLRIKQLEKLYNDKLIEGASIAAMASNTSINTVSKSTVRDRDTLERNSKVYIYPEYKSEINLGKWITGYSIANKDSTSYKINVYNEMDAIIYRQKGEWKVDGILANPYSEFKYIRALNVTGPKPKRLGIGVSTGYGGVLFDNQVRVAPFAGVSLSYHIAEF